MIPDSIISPAATKRVAPSPKPVTDPNLTTGTVSPQYGQTPPANPAQAMPQPVQQQTLPNNYSNTPTGNAKVAPRTPNAPNTTVVETAPTVQQQSGTSLYVLRNGLNVRAKATVKSKSLGRLKLNDQVYFLEEVSQTAETVRLENGTEVTKPWFKIKTKRGTIGWVHGSGVDFYKRKPQDML